MVKGTHHTKETLEKMSKVKKGTNRSLETRKKISEALKGNKCSLGHKHSIETRKKMGEIKKGIKRPHEIREKISKTHKGLLHSEETKKKLSRIRKKMRGEKSSNWKGGITPGNIRIRNSIETRLWREAVFARDNWTCQQCNKKGGILHSHHIKSFAKFPELRFAIDNGITFCNNCHGKIHWPNQNIKPLMER